MGKTITLSDPQVTGINLDLVHNSIYVNWVINDDRGRVYDKGTFTFWYKLPVTMVPSVDENGDIILDGGEPVMVLEPNPDNWKEIPTTAKSALTTIINMVQSFIDTQDL